MNRNKLYRFLEFSFIWIGFCFAIISISSFQWLVTGSCCRSGLFNQCGDGNGECVCSDHTGKSLRLTTPCLKSSLAMFVLFVLDDFITDYFPDFACIMLITKSHNFSPTRDKSECRQALLNRDSSSPK